MSSDKYSRYISSDEPSFGDRVRAAQQSPKDYVGTLAWETQQQVSSCLGCWRNAVWLWCLAGQKFWTCDQSIAIKWEENRRLQ